MTTSSRTLPTPLLALLLATTIGAAGQPVEGSIEPFLKQPFMEMNQVFPNERFPNVVVTRQGTVLATWGNKQVRARRSEDGGKTWGAEIIIAKTGFQGGGTTVDETSGDIITFIEDHHPPAPITVHRSRDDGRTWRPQQTSFIGDSKGNLLSMHMNEHGITLRHGTHKGRLLRAARYYGKGNAREEWPTHYTSAIYSDDGGTTWRASEPFPENGTGEAAVAELSNGRIYYNSRVHWDQRPMNRRRREAWSDDGGQTWGAYRIVNSLPDGPQDTNYGCMAGLERLPVIGRDILIYSNCDSPSGRHHGTVWASFDGGGTWPVKRLVFEGRFAYSSLTAGRPGTATEGMIFLHFEGGPTDGSTLARFNLSWILLGQPTGEGSVPGDPRR